jgi:phosphoglycerate dehydrogenase-like enzyme
MDNIDIVLPEWLAVSYGAQIEDTAYGRIRLLPVNEKEPAQADISHAQVALHGFWFGPTRFSSLLPSLPALRWIHITGAGIDDLASPELQKRGVWLTNVSGAYAPAMAEYALATMVMMSRHFRQWLEAGREHRWPSRIDTSGSELRGKQVGIIGYGGVGRHLATACRALGMQVWGMRRTPIFSTGEPVDRLLAAHELPLLLETSDFIVIAASLNSTTRHLIDAAAFRTIKKGAFLVNMARGEVVDQSALLNALNEGILAGASLDVTTPEPLPAENPLWNAANIWITPHVSGDTREGWQRGIDLFCANLRLFLDGRPERMGNIVDLSAHL